MVVEKIKYDESLRSGTDKLNASIEQSNDAIKEATTAKSTANQAVSTSQEAVTKAESVQEQFNQVVIEGDSSVEAAQARVDAKNVAQPTLKARLDKDYNEVTAQLAKIASFPKRQGVETDDTLALQRAIDSGKTVIVVGELLISSTIRGRNIKIQGHNRNSKITMTASNLPIFEVTGGSFTLLDCTIGYSTFQDITKTNSRAVTPATDTMVDLCKIERVSINNAYSAVYSDWTVSNKVFYSCHFSDLNISNFSHSAMYLKGGTGCVVNNIYAHNWADYQAGIVRVTDFVFFFGDYSEFTFTQLNAEWTEPKNPVLVLNQMETCVGHSLHVEGVDFKYNNSSIISFISSNVDISGINVMNNDMMAVTNLNMFAVSGRCRVKLNNIKERDNDTVSLSTNLVIGSDTNTDTAIYIDNIQLQKFSKATYFPTNQYNLVPVKRLDNNIFEEKKNNQIVRYVSSLPSTNRRVRGEKYILTGTPIPGGYEGSYCVKGGYFTNAPVSDVTATTSGAFVSVINVNKQGEFLVGDRISIAGSSRDYVITAITGTQFTLDQNVEIQLTNAIVSFNTPVLKGFGLIEA